MDKSFLLLFFKKEALPFFLFICAPRRRERNGVTITAMNATLRYSAAILMLSPGFARAQTPMVVMSDTAAYCAQLELRLAASSADLPAPQEVRALIETGHRMCRDGEIRGGIAQLRRALLTLRAMRATDGIASTAPPHP